MENYRDPGSSSRPPISAFPNDSPRLRTLRGGAPGERLDEPVKTLGAGKNHQQPSNADERRRAD
jgi:hypothetical protein